MKHQQTINAFRRWAKENNKELPAGTNKELERLLMHYRPDQPPEALIDYYAQSILQQHDELLKLVQLRFSVINHYIDFLNAQAKKE